MSPYGGSLSYIMDSFHFTHNFLPPNIINNLVSKYSLWSDDDKPSDYWPDKTKSKNAVVKVQKLTKQEEVTIRDFLFESNRSVFQYDNRLKDCVFTVYKAEPGYVLSKHNDHVAGSLTVFITPNTVNNPGGDFVWYDVNDNKHIIKNNLNTGIQWKNLYKEPKANPYHETTVNNTDRFTLQMFIMETE